ncbi:MAG TPA: hypothetical protein VHW46_01425 [Terracidiphilus sp.]|jgi:hypothetical protein|nr:hypothetical protein [Terracidiphilus sp.]
MATTKKKPAQPTQAPVQQQPQSKELAAKLAGMFLHTDSAWSDAYWANGDLHCEERQLFG